MYFVRTNLIVSVGCIVGIAASTAGAQKVYWTDNGAVKIQRARLDGTNVEDLVMEGLSDPQGIALDLPANKMYWTDAGSLKIQRANLDGSNIEDLITTGLESPKAIALDLSAGMMYWIDNGRIQRADLTGTGVEDLGINIHGIDIFAKGIALFPDWGMMYFTADGAAFRATLDGSYVELLWGSMIGNPWNGGVAIDPSALKMYFTLDDYVNPSPFIFRSNLDGTNAQPLVSASSRVEWLALDLLAGKFYWTVVDKIRRANLDGSVREDVVTTGLSGLGGIALDPRCLIAGSDCQPNGITDECDIMAGTSSDCDSNGIPDECEPDEDCNGNGAQDMCDIFGGASQDCNANGVPDECEPDEDCNGNGVQDICDMASGTSDDCNGNLMLDECDIGEGASEDCNANDVPDECETDCNGNGVPNECDIAAGASEDLNANGIPDECECPPAVPQLAPATAPKSRYLSLNPGSAGQLTALRVTFVDLPDPFDVFNSSTMWAGQPRRITEKSNRVDPADAPGWATLWAATLQCHPYYTDWSEVGTIHLYHEAIVPGGMYEIQAIDDICEPTFEDDYSARVELKTGKWGDVCGPSFDGACTGPADGLVDVANDVLASVGKFSNMFSVPKAMVDLSPHTPDRLIDIIDVMFAVEAFRGADYPFAPRGNPCP